MKKLLVYLAVGLLPMLFFKCTLKEDLNKLESTLKDSVQLYIGTPKFSTLAHIEFVDAETNLLIDGKDIKVAITGKDSAVMYNNVGTQMKEYTAKWGMLDLVADPHKIDTSALITTPVEFVVTPILEGYEAKSQLVMLTNPNENSITIPMTKVSSVETVKVDAGNTDANGELGGDVTINFAPKRNLRSSSASTGLSLSFLPGTTLLSSSGAKLEGKVSVSSGFLGNLSNPKYSDLTYNMRYFSKYLQFSYSIYVTANNGVQTLVARFGKGGVVLTAPLPAGFINEQTSSPFKVGDQIERWLTSSLPRGSSVKDPVLSVNGSLAVKATITSVENLKSTWGCSLPAVINRTTIVFNGIVTRYDAKAQYRVFSNGKPIIASQVNLYNPKGLPKVESIQCVVYAGKPANFSLSNVSDNPSSMVTFSPSDFTNAGGGTYSKIVTVIQPSVPVQDIVAVNIDLSVVKKTSPNLAIKPNANLQVGVAGAMSVFKLVDGKANFSLKLGQVYIVRGAFGTASGQGTLSVVESGANYVAKFILPIGATPGKEFSYTIPKTADKTININYTIPVSDEVFNQMKQK